MIYPLPLWPHLIPLTFRQPPVNLQAHPPALAPRSSLSAVPLLSLSSPGHLQDFLCPWLASVSETPRYLYFSFPVLFFSMRVITAHLFYVPYIISKANQPLPHVPIKMPFTPLSHLWALTPLFGFSHLFPCFYNTSLRHWLLFTWSCSCSRYNSC